MTKSVFASIQFSLFVVVKIQLLKDQDEPRKSFTELKVLLQKSKVDIERGSIMLEAAFLNRIEIYI